MTASLSEELKTLAQRLEAKGITEAEYNILVKDAVARHNKGVKDTVSYLAEQADYQLSPWKIGLQEAQDFWADCPDLTEDKIKEKFLRMAKHKQLSPMIVLVCMYLLFTTDKEIGRTRILQLLLFAPSDKMVDYHNWHIYECLLPQEQRIFGELIAHCPLPFYPPWPELSHLNEEARQIVRQGKSLNGGGDAHTDITEMRRLYGTTSLDVLEGAGFEPVLNAQGEQIAAVDRSLTEAALQQVQQSIQNLSAALAKSASTYRGRGRGGGRSRWSRLQQLEGSRRKWPLGIRRRRHREGRGPQKTDETRAQEEFPR
ncbi:hypothetical protein ABB37_10124 [Leptomonas pyrrhocoris]|uniref:TATE DNA Transposon n=1 Tax=Leptomonas pyrrhocoris TaxID=157538 RepID=A0A0N0VCJ9_LEPPY|nr:hypothetical protein ABB37_10124 [Leptomonas pyrrhocoris]KPA73094.1 hypothetical protein ABB37_10124 [Leptomonas pyrrhocoris]|eukprot:XP_015651533.1 hypothetical protein ABB37_10124 [Leptomonas pyrrhocoris]